jgi:hypothetical protein
MVTLRVAIGDVETIHMARRGDFSLMVRPPLMLLDFALEQGLALMTEDEMAVVRDAVPGKPLEVGAYADLFPTLTCPCSVPVELRVSDWPACPAHNPDTPTGSVVEVAEWITSGEVGPIRLDRSGGVAAE